MFGFDKMFGSLTLSPVQSAINEARRMAQRRLEAGGSVSSAKDRQDADGASDFIVPPDVDLIPIALAIKTKLHAAGCSYDESRKSALQAIEPGSDGRVVIPAGLLSRLGDGDHKQGRKHLERLVSDLRIERLLRSIAAQPPHLY
jgi:hypothetical protein